MSNSMPLRPRGLDTYAKPALAHTELVDRLEQRGLTIPDRERATRYVRHIGYYRLSPYAIPFQERDGTHTFDPGTTFDEILTLYVFDRQLRLLVLDALERVEVAIRAALTDTMATAHGPHWYIDPRHFRDTKVHAGLLHAVREESAAQLRRPAENDDSRLNFRSALEHYLTHYAEPELPPSWIMVEGLTLGGLSHLYRNLRDSRPKQLVAGTVGINEPLLDSWLRTYVRIRNICAHHGRLWNVGLGVYPKLASSLKVAWPRGVGAVPDRYRRRLYPALASLQSILTTVSPGSSWRSRLVDLLAEHPSVQPSAIGLPPHWLEDPFWKSSPSAGPHTVRRMPSPSLSHPTPPPRGTPT